VLCRTSGTEVKIFGPEEMPGIPSPGEETHPAARRNVATNMQRRSMRDDIITTQYPGIDISVAKNECPPHQEHPAGSSAIKKEMKEELYS
jgi:hypothetical protein